MSPTDPAAQPLSSLPGVGARTAEKLASRGLLTLQDLWTQLPRQYEDRTRIVPLRELQSGVACQVEGVIEAVERGFRYRPTLRVAIGDDSRASLVLRFFHFRAAQAAQFRPGERVRCYGTPRPGQYGLEMVHPSYQLLGRDEGGALDERLHPVYPQIEGIGAAAMRRMIGHALDRLPEGDGLESLPAEALRTRGLPPLREALLTVHRPPPDADLAALLAVTHPAQRRLILEELLAHHLSLRRHRIAQQQHAAPVLAAGGALGERLRAALPFALTGAQERVLAQVSGDIARPVPMLRLVQGDVGSGKTVVAALAAAAGVEA
ncbi:MAG TPA: ATP-dependent DNA helicase RecG, partial [Candidatus Luteimonas excrementigallinarum]|nr:ATP-dependent DNA helicase RecG [Candidatus Luteimonas excrementigallinarum]